MSTLIFCTSFSNNPLHWQQRYRKWVDYFASSLLEFDQMLMVDDGSPILPEWSDFEVLTELPAHRPSAKKVLFHFSNNLGRQSNLHHPGWFRSFGFAAQYAKAHQFTKIVHIESDAYLMSTRMFDFVNNCQTGWTTFWCPRWQCEESAIQVICRDHLEVFLNIAQQDYDAVYAGKFLDKMLPYTSVRKDFVGDRYTEGNGSIPVNVDYICQFPTELKIDALANQIKQQSSSFVPHQNSQSDIGKLFQQGLALHQQDKLAQAKMKYEEVLKANPKHFDALHLLGTLAAQSGQFQLAVDLIGKAIEINPNQAAAYSNFGNALKKLKQFEAALSSYDKAISIKPDYAEAYYNRGVVLQELNRLDEALQSYDKAINIQTDYAEAYYNRGIVLKELKRLNEALQSYDKVISIQHDDVDAYWNKSLALLLCGEFEEGLRLYEWRWKNTNLGLKLPIFSQPLWLGTESLKGQTILLHSEQGLGDTIQFCRYAKQVKALGARVVMEAPAALLPLLQSLEGVDELVAKSQELPAFDYHCPLASLPLAFKTELHTIPSPEPYLRSDSAKVAQWSTRLGPKTKPRIGLVWSGSPSFKNDHNRSLRLDELLPYLPEGFEYVCLQKEIREVDEQALKQSNIQYFGDALKDFADTAALCELMDVVISVDTSVAHLSGALGRPTWVLLQYVPDWRWLLDREDSPWYDSVKLYRQDDDRSWASVFEKVKSALLQDESLEEKIKVDEKGHDKLTHQKNPESLREVEIAKQFTQGLVLHQQGQLAQAKALYQAVLKANPKHFDALHMQGVIALMSNDAGLAVSLIGEFLQQNKSNPDAYFNHGLAAQANAQPLLAIESYDKAISLNSRDEKLYWNKSLSLLSIGRFDEGWQLYEYGWQGNQQRGIQRICPEPMWLNAQSLKGQTILLHSEQGLGDTIQFCRYAKQVKALGARVVMEAPAALLPLLQSLEGVDELVTKGQELPAFDYHCPLASLPLAFKTELHTIPSPEPYLQSDSAKVAQWRAKLGPQTKPRIGLVWSGSSGHKNDHNRSLRLDELMPYLPEGFEYVCLQKEVREVDEQALKQSNIQYFGDALKDFADTAALCELMDVVISVDTSVAHLSGALGKPTWVLLEYVPDWRWLLGREDSPWYGSVKLHRQDDDRSWTSVLKKVAAALLQEKQLAPRIRVFQLDTTH